MRIFGTQLEVLKNDADKFFNDNFHVFDKSAKKYGNLNYIFF